MQTTLQQRRQSYHNRLGTCPKKRQVLSSRTDSRSHHQSAHHRLKRRPKRLKRSLRRLRPRLILSLRSRLIGLRLRLLRLKPRLICFNPQHLHYEAKLAKTVIAVTNWHWTKLPRPAINLCVLSVAAKHWVLVLWSRVPTVSALCAECVSARLQTRPDSRWLSFSFKARLAQCMACQLWWSVSRLTFNENIRVGIYVRQSYVACLMMKSAS